MAGLLSLAPSLPIQQVEPREAAGLRGRAAKTDLKPQAVRLQPAPRSRSPARRGAVPPGSAAASADQVEALLDRLEEVEAEAVGRRQSEEELKAVNIALMGRLSEFQVANEDNVRQAESQLVRMHDELQWMRRRYADAETALVEARQQIDAQREHAAAAGLTAEEALREADAVRACAAEASHVVAQFEARRAAHATVRSEVHGREHGMSGGLLASVRARMLLSHSAAWRRQLWVARRGSSAVGASSRRWCGLCLAHWRRWCVATRSGRRALWRRNRELRARVLAAWSTVLASRRTESPALLSKAANLRPALSKRAALRRWAAHCERRGGARRLAAEVVRRGCSGFAFLRRRAAMARWAGFSRLAIAWLDLWGRAAAMQLLRAVRGWRRSVAWQTRSRLMVLRAGGADSRTSLALALKAWRLGARLARRAHRSGLAAAAHYERHERRRRLRAFGAWRVYNDARFGSGSLWPTVRRRCTVLAKRAGFRAFRHCAALSAHSRAAVWWSARLAKRSRAERLIRGMLRWRGLAARFHRRRRAAAETQREESVALLAQARASSAALERENAQVSFLREEYGLWRRHRNTNRAFRLVYPNTYIYIYISCVCMYV